MDIVTFETAKALKAAGFPQPEPKFRQSWYDKSFPNVEMVYVKKAFKSDYFIFRDQEGGRQNYYDVDIAVDLVFAPTATDILRELKGCCLFSGAGFIVDAPSQFTKAMLLTTWDENYYNPNPAEAAAQAWLKLNGG